MKMHRLGAIVVIGLLAACGSSDDEPAAGSSEETAAPADEPTAESEPAGDSTAEDNAQADDADAADADAADDDAADDDGDDGNTVSIDSLDDIPQECRDLLGDFLRDIEPLVSDIDWGNATMSDLEALGTSIDEPVSEMDVKMEQAGCDDIDFDGDDEQGFELSLELARQEAPGAVAWLEFLREVSTAFDTSGTAVDSADAPEDCDGALEAVRDLMSESETMTDLPVDQLMSAASILQSITSLCSIDEMAALFDDPAFTEWSGG